MLLRDCALYECVFGGKSAPVSPKRRKASLRLLAEEFNNAMKKKRSENPQNKEMYRHYVENFVYVDNPLFLSLKKCVQSHIRSAAQKRERNTDPLSKGTASSGKGAAGGAAKANPPMEGAAGGAAKADAPMEEGAPRRNREKPKFSWDEIDRDVVDLIENLDMCQHEEMERFNKFLIENFGDPYKCKELNNRAPRVFFMEQLLMRMHHRCNMLYDVKMFEDEGGKIQHFLRPGRKWKVFSNKIGEYNAAFRGMQDAYFGRYERSKGFKLKGTTACMDMFRALGFVPIEKAKAHNARFYRGPEANDPTKMRDGQGKPIFSNRDCLYFLEYEYNTKKVHNNLNHLWKDAKHKLRQCVNPNKRNLNVLLQAAQAVDSESSSERASESNSLGYSSKRAKFQ